MVFEIKIYARCLCQLLVVRSALGFIIAYTLLRSILV